LSDADLLWLGSRGGIERRLVELAGIRFVGLAAGGLRGLGFTAKLRNAWRIVGSIGQARATLRSFEPNVLLATGGYVTVAATLAAWTLGIPVVIYLPDIIPGLAIRFLSRFAAKIAVSSEESYHHFPREKVVVTGYPVRSEVFCLEKTAARQELNLDVTEKTLLVFGGSRGARSINQALMANLRELLPICQILHISGSLDADWVAGMAKRLPDDLRQRYHHFAYLDEMPRALKAADLAVARAGASVMGEFPAAGLPSVLVPYPYSGQHQSPNAAYMERNGAAVVLPDSVLKERLAPTILALLRDEPALAEMRESTAAMARPDAAEAIALELWQLGKKHAILISSRTRQGKEKDGES
jgi:UDP-N-acetylglucosamine--N-acetylmuramyl-(pentapeptide) pyrophosphoryl-undecaprenol N-acetylglucosamine transferase